MKKIRIDGAKLHNLKNIDVEIPKNKLIVATGISGSGKSTLMFDIVFEEGRKQYLKSLGVFNDIEDAEKFTKIQGLGPTIAVKQNIIRQSNPRSTVGSRTGILSLLSLLISAYGALRCEMCDTKLDDDLVCKACAHENERLLVNYFSYNHPNGMCPTCSGRGFVYDFNLDNLLPNESSTLREIFDYIGITSGFLKLVERLYEGNLDTPFWDLPDHVRVDALYGHNVSGTSDKLSYCFSRIFQSRLQRHEDTSHYYYKKVCPDCSGYRVGQDARDVLISGKHIGQLSQMTLDDLLNFLLSYKKNNELPNRALKILNEIIIKLNGMNQSKIGHLSLYREMPTLSGGEIQRLFLFNHLSSKLDSLIYVLDEPTVGLHESEKIELMDSIKHLRDIGNTVIVVEHDAMVISKADYIIDIGPLAGINGGEVMYQGTYEGLLTCEKSITGQYLSERMKLPSRQIKSSNDLINSELITITSANSNNLKDVTVSFPKHALVGVCGVSGSGKSSLISQTLILHLKSYFKDNDSVVSNLKGLSGITNYCEVSQSPIGRNINSTPASYTGIWDKIRKLFASQPLAKSMLYKPGHFSFNSIGACEKCGGSGTETIWLGGSYNLKHTCDGCHGKRYSDEALSVRYKGKNIYDVLEMSISDCVEFFKDEQSITKILKNIDAIGMGYIKLGQPTTTLSGGEAQRIKLAKELSKKQKGHTLYILDEPTTGLSLYDTSKLITLLDQLVLEGNTVIVVEHDTHVLNICDWLIEIGPEGGNKGGYVVAEGTPDQLKKDKNSKTGRYL